MLLSAWLKKNGPTDDGNAIAGRITHEMAVIEASDRSAQGDSAQARV